MEYRETELCNKLYKTEKEQQMFLGFSIFETRAKGNSEQSEIFLDFSNSKPKIASKASQRWKAKETNREKQRKYFWSFCVLESRNKN
jgi:hypothetical protein